MCRRTSSAGRHQEDRRDDEQQRTGDASPARRMPRHGDARVVGVLPAGPFGPHAAGRNSRASSPSRPTASGIRSAPRLGVYRQVWHELPISALQESARYGAPAHAEDQPSGQSRRHPGSGFDEDRLDDLAAPPPIARSMAKSCRRSTTTVRRC